MRSPIALGDAQQRSKPINPARVLNLYPEPVPQGSRAKVVHYGTPGQVLWTTAGTGTIRAGRDAFGYGYVLSGGSLYRLDSTGAATLCTGDTISPTGPAMMAFNGVQLVVQSDTEAFVVTGTTVTKITDADFPGCSSLDYIDGYIVYTKPDSGQWFISDLFNASAYDATDFATAESSPDGLIRVLVDHREVWLFGTNSIEPWTNTGASPFPFERVNGAIIERGCAAALSPAKMDNSVFWLGDDRIVYRAQGYQPTRISTHAIEEILRSGTVDDAFGMTYSQGGHHFYILTLPTMGRTLVFDAAASAMLGGPAWHERQSGTSTDYAVWNPKCMFSLFGRILVGLTSGQIAELDLDTYTDISAPIRRAITSLPIYPDGDRAIMDSVELECELGVGLTSGQGVAPVVMLRFSDDGGGTYSNERRASIGAKGLRRDRATWERCGIFRQRTIEFSVSDPVKTAMYGARAMMRKLDR
ncbi:packaged DNA stabilization protein [uncultured Bradyrhizobium sp.]|uniref:packaged DNA stabilization protein n=1 Tax=uncultured Bradyrhizobium sp. TaxID=199684 RepID=UPI00260C7EA0|nr:packaged DNA stabilization protein [uncultured Bradyrhizobium sp.]